MSSRSRLLHLRAAVSSRRTDYDRAGHERFSSGRIHGQSYGHRTAIRRHTNRCGRRLFAIAVPVSYKLWGNNWKRHLRVLLDWTQFLYYNVNIGPPLRKLTAYVELKSKLSPGRTVVSCLVVRINVVHPSIVRFDYMQSSPSYSILRTILIGITNSFASLPGIAAPVLASAMTPNVSFMFEKTIIPFNHDHFPFKNTRSEWLRVFWASAGILCFGAIFYAIFGSGELQEWAEVRDAESKEQISDADSTRSTVATKC